MGFTSDACWFLLIKTLPIKNKKREVALKKNRAGGDEKRVCVFLFGLIPDFFALSHARVILINSPPTIPD